jgi:hypothetical protein
MRVSSCTRRAQLHGERRERVEYTITVQPRDYTAKSPKRNYTVAYKPRNFTVKE